MGILQVIKFFGPLQKMHQQSRDGVLSCTAAERVRTYLLHAYLHTFATEKTWRARADSPSFQFSAGFQNFFVNVSQDGKFYAIGCGAYTSFFGFPLANSVFQEMEVDCISWADRFAAFKKQSGWYIAYHVISMVCTTIKNTLKTLVEFIPHVIERLALSGYMEGLLYYRQSTDTAILRHCAGVAMMGAMAVLYSAAKVTRLLARTVTSPVRSAYEGWRVAKPLGVLSACCTIAAYVFLLPAVLPVVLPKAACFLGAKFLQAMHSISSAFPFAGLGTTGATGTAVAAHLTGEVALTGVAANGIFSACRSRATPVMVEKHNPSFHRTRAAVDAVSANSPGLGPRRVLGLRAERTGSESSFSSV